MFFKWTDYSSKNNSRSFSLSNRYSLAQVQEHNKNEDCWIVLSGLIYDVTDYIKYHPGGDIILEDAGKDATEAFETYHPWVNYKSILSKFMVGTLLS